MGFGGKLGLSGLAGIVMALALASPAFAQVPEAPTIGTAWGGDGQATVFFTAPASNGGPAITGYTITSSPGGIAAGGAGYTSPISIYGLTNGTPYTFTVTATNADGTSPASSASNSVTPKGNQTITFTNPGTRLFDAPPTLTVSPTSGLPVSFSSSTMSVCTTSSGGTLTFVAPGSCAIKADQDGDGAWNAASTVTQTFTVNAVSPDAPTIGTATAGDGQATVSFTPPTSNGGSNITAYTVTSNPGGLTETGSNSPITVTGLTNGVSYTFTVTATNATSLTGIASAASNSVTPVAAQSITFTNPGQQLNTASLTVTATADFGLPVSFSATTPAVCTVTSIGVMTFTGLGICTLEANQPGTGSYLAASTVTQSFNVVSGTIVLSPTGGALPAGRIWLTYGQTIALSGGTAPFVYSVTAGALPAGLSLTGGTIAGTPTASSIAAFTLMVTDLQPPTNETALDVVHGQEEPDLSQTLFSQVVAISLATRIAGKKIKPDMESDIRPSVRIWTEVLGDRAIGSYRRADMLEYLSVLQQVPKIYWKSQASRQLSILEVVARARADAREAFLKTSTTKNASEVLLERASADYAKLNHVTINRHLSAICPVFEWAYDNHYLPEDTRIFWNNLQLQTGSPYSGLKANEERPAFSAQQILTIFNHPIWLGRESEYFYNKPGDVIIRDSLYWGPIIALLHGMRLEEFAQLRVQHVRMIEGIWVFDLYANGLDLKNVPSKRYVPLHSWLLKLGFIEAMNRTGFAGGYLV